MGAEYHPTGKKITVTAVVIWRIVDCEVVEGWRVHDHLDYFKQLGVIEYTEKAKKVFREDVTNCFDNSAIHACMHMVLVFVFIGLYVGSMLRKPSKS